MPENAQFQKKVLHSALKLLEAKQGPVLTEFKEEAPGSDNKALAEEEQWACPVNFSPSSEKETKLEKKIASFKREIAELRPWYDLGMEKRGRTSITEFAPESSAEILCNYLLGEQVEIPREDISFAAALRLAYQDLKAFYFESAISRPGAKVPDSKEFTEWFWNQTEAGGILRDVQKKCTGEQDQELQLTGKMFLVPMKQ